MITIKSLKTIFKLCKIYTHRISKKMEKIPFRMTTEQENNLRLSLIKQGLNDVQISDIFQRIKNEKDYLKYLKS